MKYIYFTLLAFMMSYRCQGQQAITRADKMNILYVAVDNPITLMADVNMEEVTLSMPEANIKFIHENRYIITPKKVGAFTLDIKYKGQLIGQEVYRVKALPPATAAFVIADEELLSMRVIEEGTMTKAELIAQKGVGLTLDNFDFMVQMSVREYTLSIFRAGAKQAERTFKDGPEFNNAAILMLENLQPGDELFISGVKYEIVDPKVSHDQLYKTENAGIKIKIK